MAVTKCEKITFGLSQEVKKQHKLLTDTIFSCVIFGMIMVHYSFVIFAAIVLAVLVDFTEIATVRLAGISIASIQAGEYICIRGINKEFFLSFLNGVIIDDVVSFFSLVLHFLNGSPFSTFNASLGEKSL
ncbi:MAG UNVERIFIED_CONTAM: hypothetical protein LVR29_32970 [Microcystis novacekii LVE1205-3]